MPEALSAASLLLAMIALIFGAWWPQLIKAANHEFQDEKGNRTEERKPVAATFVGQALPLSFAALAAALVFLPRARRLTSEALACGCPTPDRLNDVSAAFVLSEALLCLVAAAALVQTVRIAINLKRSYD
ncbi:MAG TPA: hypothetical protein DIV82_03750 [Brevundimonas diminuta]|nr:hypothetical protein [Brevundimonas diminuta]